MTYPNEQAFSLTYLDGFDVENEEAGKNVGILYSSGSDSCELVQQPAEIRSISSSSHVSCILSSWGSTFRPGGRTSALTC